MKGVRDKPTLIFLHLPKTAGSTLARIIERQYHSNGRLVRHDLATGADLAALPMSRRANLDAVIGHHYFGVHTLLPRPTIYITMLRDPIDRVISYYFHVRSQPGHDLYQRARELTLRDFVVACDLTEPNNDQTRLLAGTAPAMNSGLCTPEMLPVAERNLREHFGVGGLTEEFDRSLILMKRLLGWRDPFYRKQNVTRHRPSRADVPQEALEIIRQYNWLDIDLYHSAKERFHEHIRLQDESFEREVRRFQHLNASYGRLRLLLPVAAARLGTGRLR